MSEEAYLRTLAKYHSDIRTGALPFNYKTGQCGPVQATQLRSWGGACPPGYCPPDQLPEAIGRWFAGDRSGCKEIPYTVLLSATGSATLDVPVRVERVSKVTMCPTRMIMVSNLGSSSGPWEITKIQFGNQNQIVGGPFPPEAFDTGAFQAVPFVPDCLRAGQPFEIEATLKSGAAVVSTLAVVFIGPAQG